MCTEKDYKSKKDNASDGTFYSFFTQKYFLKIKQCFNIDKVLFSFVKKGTKGQSVDVYVDTDEFDLLCDMILNKSLKTAIDAENSIYPSSWVYNTGNSGQKSVAIGKGDKMPIVFQGKVDKNYVLIGIDNYQRLIRMARIWKKLSKVYFEEIYEVAIKATHNSEEGKNEEKYYGQDEEMDGQNTKTGVSQSKQPTQPAKSQEKVVKIRVVATAPCKEREKAKGDYAMQGKNVENDERVNIVFKKESISGMSVKTWKTLLEKSADKQTPLDFTANFIETMEGETKVFVFKEFAK